MCKTTSSAIVNSTATVLKCLEQKAEQPLDPAWHEKLLQGELSLSDAIGLIYVAIDRGTYCEKNRVNDLTK